MEDHIPLWTLVGHCFSSSGSRLVLQVDIQFSNLTTIIVEKPENEDDIADWKTQLFYYFQATSSASAEAANQIIDCVLESCRQRYGKGSPLLGNSLYLRDASGQPQIIEAMDPALESLLRTAPECFGNELALPPLVSRSDLQYTVVEEGSFMAQTNPVRFQGELYVAKSPASAESAREDLSEVSNLLSLPTRHPNIIPPPTALITLSKDDKRICGYLFPLYKHGNLDLYASKNRTRDQSFDQSLRTWYKQLVLAVKSLVDFNTYHGDIKPDNILLSDSNEVILIDFTRSSTTMAVASPEVKESKRRVSIKDVFVIILKMIIRLVIVRTGKVRIPPNWPIQKIEKSEVYSIGRTIFFLSEGISMSDIYHNKGPDNGTYPTKFHVHSSTPAWLQQIILESVNENPLARPCLSELAMRLALMGS